jgi:hypothetical protein
MEFVMNNKWMVIWLSLVLLNLGGCASMSSDECMASDWSAVGYEDGSRGYTSDRFSQHRKACAKHGVTADFSAYQSGREQGLVEYCQPGRGFSVGVNGGGYNGVCSANQERDFLEAYNAGHQLYTLRSNVNRATSQINSKEYELDRLEKSIAANALAMIAADTSNEERVLMVVDLKNMSERTGQLQAEIRDLQDYRARSQVELDNYQVMLADLGY